VFVENAKNLLTPNSLLRIDVTISASNRNYMVENRNLFGQLVPRGAKMGIAILIITLLSTLTVGGVAYAADSSKPGDFLFPVDKAEEEVLRFVNFGEAQKADLEVNIMDERVKELEASRDENQIRLAIKECREQLNRALTKAEEAKAKGLNTDEVFAKVSEVTLKHLSVLADVYGRVPEQAKPAIEQALQVSVKGHEKALEAVSRQKREEVIQKVEQKRQEVEQKVEKLRHKGAPIPTIPTREELKEKIKHQENEQNAGEETQIQNQNQIQNNQPTQGQSNGTGGSHSSVTSQQGLKN
jgi:hypothetical protein